MPIPHTNSPILPIGPFTVPKRVFDKPNTVRRQLLEVIDVLCSDGAIEFRLDTLLSILNLEDDERRRWTVQRAVSRMQRGDHGRPPEIARVRPGVYRKL